MYNLQNVSFLRMQCAIISGLLVCYKHDLQIFHMLNGCNALKLLWYRNLQRKVSMNEYSFFVRITFLYGNVYCNTADVMD